MTTMRLTKTLWATGIHGVTGRPTEEGWLAGGTLVRNVKATGAAHPLDGMPWYRFDASTDGGRTWFTQEVCGEPAVEPAGEPTRADIASLQDEAVAAGDDAMASICAAALDGDPVALAEVARCLREAAAQSGT